MKFNYQLSCRNILFYSTESATCSVWPCFLAFFCTLRLLGPRNAPWKVTALSFSQCDGILPVSVLTRWLRTRKCAHVYRFGRSWSHLQEPDLLFSSLWWVDFKISVTVWVKFCLQINCCSPSQGKEYAISEENSLNMSTTLLSLLSRLLIWCWSSSSVCRLTFFVSLLSCWVTLLLNWLLEREFNRRTCEFE